MTVTVKDSDGYRRAVLHYLSMQWVTTLGMGTRGKFKRKIVDTGSRTIKCASLVVVEVSGIELNLIEYDAHTS